MIRLFYILIFMIPAIPVFAKYDKAFDAAVRKSVAYQIDLYPKSTLKDLYKNFFQDRFGPGHIINDTLTADRYLSHELNSYSEDIGIIAEPTGIQHNFYRVNLSVIKRNLIPYKLFLDAFIRSANSITPVSIEEWREEWNEIEKIIRSMDLSLPGYNEDMNEICAGLKKGYYVVHHSPIFNKEYAPHYRIISRDIYQKEFLALLNN